MSKQLLFVQNPKAVHLSNSQKNRNRIILIIPFDRLEVTVLRKDQYLSFKLRSNPQDEASATYELTVPYYRSGTPEELLMFCENIQKVIVGQNITQGPAKYALAKRLLQGEALAQFKIAAQSLGAETIAHFKSTMEQVITDQFPRQSLILQKRFMRRALRKPRDIKIRAFYNRLIEINERLNNFPPHGENQKLNNVELLEIAQYAIPTSWYNKMVEQGFEPISHTQIEFIEFCERLEYIESTDVKSKGADAKPHQ